MRLGANSIHDGKKRDQDFLQYAWKATIHDGLEKNLHNSQKGRDIFPKLQEILSKYKKKYSDLVAVLNC